MTRNVPNDPGTQGYAAFKAGKSWTENPHNHWEIEYEQWIDGWFEAQADADRKKYGKKSPLPDIL